MKCPFCKDGELTYAFTNDEGLTWSKEQYSCSCGVIVLSRYSLELYNTSKQSKIKEEEKET